MNRFLAVIPGASVGPKQSSYNSGIIAKVPGQLKGKLVAVAQTAAVAVCGSCVDPWKEPRTSEPEDRATNDPVPYSSISGRVAQTAAVAVCGSCVDPSKEPRTSEPEDRATGRPAGIATLFIHARHHFLTLEFTENGAKQAAVFEIGKAIPLTLLPVLEARTGKKVEYQSKKK